MNAQAPSFADPASAAVAPRSAIAAWRRRSVLIRFWRRALPLAIAAIVLAIGGQLAVRGFQAVAPVDEPEQAEIRIVNPRFIGRDQGGRAFVLEATEAVRVRGDDTLIRMVEPRLTLQGQGRPITVRSRIGWWRERDEVAIMRGTVIMNDPVAGSTFRTEEAIVNTRTDVITGNSPIDGSGPTGRISAQRYTIYDQGQRIVLRGAVQGRLNNGAGVPGASQAGLR